MQEKICQSRCGNSDMGWLTKILRGSSHKISEGQYHGKYHEERFWEGPSTSVVIRDSATVM